MATPLNVRHLGLSEYLPTWEAMRAFTEQRKAGTTDEIWLLQHPPVYTLGLNGKQEHLLAPGEIPVIPVDRGGQVTYHGPGQIVLYLLLDLRRKKLGVRHVVSAMEDAVIALLADYGIDAMARQDAPGVYVGGAKVASLGLRIRHGCSYHGLSLNVDMDLAPFSRINPCGYKDLPVTQLRDLGIDTDLEQLGEQLTGKLATGLGLAPIHDSGRQLPAPSRSREKLA